MLQRGEIFLVIGNGGVVEYDDRGGLSVTPEVVVISLDSIADIAQSMVGITN